MDKLADLKHLGLGVDGLLAAGLTVNQASSVLDWIGTDRTRFDAIRVAQTQVRNAQSSLSGIRGEMVRIGRTDELETQLLSAETQLATAVSNYAGLVDEAQSALETLVSADLQAASVWPVISRVIANRDYEVPTALRVLELDPSEWEQIELYHEMYEKRPEAVDMASVTLAQSLALNSAVTNAQSRIDNGVAPLMQALLTQ